MLNTKVNHPSLRDQLKVLKDQIVVKTTKKPYHKRKAKPVVKVPDEH